MPADTNRPTLIYCEPSVEIKLLQPVPDSFIFYYQRLWKLLAWEVIISNKIDADKWLIGAQINTPPTTVWRDFPGRVISRVNFCTAPEIGYKLRVLCSWRWALTKFSSSRRGACLDTAARWRNGGGGSGRSTAACSHWKTHLHLASRSVMGHDVVT